MRPEMNMMQPVPETYEYRTFGFVITRAVRHRCPACNAVLSAGPDYQPKFCGGCGQRVDFTGVTFPEEETLGYDSEAHMRKYPVKV